jgi:archaemetzincin
MSVLLFCLFSCSKGNSEKNDVIQKGAQRIIVIQSLGNFERDEAVAIFEKIKAINPKVVLRGNIPFPENSFYKPRNRSRADSIIKISKIELGRIL